MNELVKLNEKEIELLNSLSNIQKKLEQEM